MKILLTNDDGIYAPGLAAMERQLQQLGEVTVAAPLTEQSGVGHSITYLKPLMAREVFDDAGRRRGWAVEGSPADCVKLAICALLPEQTRFGGQRHQQWHERRYQRPVLRHGGSGN